MKVQVGIFQEKEQLKTYLRSKGIKCQNIMEAGPFPSRLEAMEWMDFVEEKSGWGEFERHAVGYMNKSPWYGCTFE